MSPSNGVRSSTFCTSSRINPPSTTVCPSQTLTLVVTLRVLKIGWLITLSVSVIAWVNPVRPAVEPAIKLSSAGFTVLIGLPELMKPSNSTTCGTRLRSIVTPSGPTTGSTSSVTPVFRVSKLEGVDGPTTGKAIVVVVVLLDPRPLMSGTFGSVNCVG